LILYPEKFVDKPKDSKNSLVFYKKIFRLFKLTATNMSKKENKRKNVFVSMYNTLNNESSFTINVRPKIKNDHRNNSKPMLN